MGMEKYSNTDWRIYGVLVHIALEGDFQETVFISCLAMYDLQVL